MKIGITGATGTLGCRLTTLIASPVNTVIALCRDRVAAREKLGPSVALHVGDITRKATLLPFVEKLDICINLAAQVDHAENKRYHEVNIDGTNNLCTAILECNPHCRLIHCSSVAVLRLDKMKTDYSLSKAEADRVIGSMMRQGLKATLVYSGLMYGPGDKRLVPHIVKGLMSGKLPLVTGGESYAPLIYIDDLCTLFIKIVQSDTTVGKSYLGIQQTSAGMHDFIRIIAEKTGYPLPDRKVPRSLLLLSAILLKPFYATPLFRGNPPIDKRTVDILSISYRPASFRNEIDLGWKPVMSMHSGIDAFLQQVIL